MIENEKQDVTLAKNIIFYDKDNKPMLCLDGIMGKKVVHKSGLAQITLNEIIKEFICAREGEIVQGVEKRELDFSQISDEEWLKLKNGKSIVFSTITK